MNSSSLGQIDENVFSKMLGNINKIITIVNELKGIHLPEHEKNILINWLLAIIEPIFDALPNANTEKNPLVILGEKEKIKYYDALTTNQLIALERNLDVISKVLNSSKMSRFFEEADIKLGSIVQQVMQRTILEIREDIANFYNIHPEAETAKKTIGAKTTMITESASVISQPITDLKKSSSTNLNNNNNANDENIPSVAPDAEGTTKYDPAKTEQLEALLKRKEDYDPFPKNEAMELVKQGADPNTRDKNGKPLIHYFNIRRSDGFENIKVLVEEYGADIDIRDLKTGHSLMQIQMKLLSVYLFDFHFPDEDELYKMLAKITCSDIESLLIFGANPDTTESGIPLLHLFSTVSFDLVENLIKKYHADVAIADSKGHTLLQKIMKHTAFNLQPAYKLVLLGADPETKLANGKTLLDWMATKRYKNEMDQKLIENLNEIISHNRIRLHLRNEFLNLLIYLARDVKHPESKSSFKILPLDIVYLIISFLDFAKMDKTWQEGVALAKEVFRQHVFIKDSAKTPGGINFFQQTEKNIRGEPSYKFRRFKSITTFSHDVEKYKQSLIAKQNSKDFTMAEKITGKILTKASKVALDKFIKKYAESYWNQHIKLYKKNANQRKIERSVKQPDLVNEIQKVYKKK